MDSNEWLRVICSLAREDFPSGMHEWEDVLSAWVTLARRAWASERKTKWRLDKINELLFSQLGLTSVSAKNKPQSIYIQTVLSQRCGNCLGLSTLYLAIADRLEIPVAPVLAHDHVFVRYDDGLFRRNIETTHGGMEWIDRIYQSRAGGREARSALRVLSREEFIAVVLVTRSAYIHAPSKDWKTAKRDLTVAIELFPGFETAHDDLAMVDRCLEEKWDGR